jgi:predicted nuclease of predicted toxin-antitoxin system
MLPEWEIWLDHNVAPIIGKWLKDDFDLRVKSAYSLQMERLSDLQIYQKAKEAGKIIIILRDSDIKGIINANGAPPKLINIKVGNCTNRFLYSILQKHIERTLRLLIDFDNNIVQIEI